MRRPPPTPNRHRRLLIAVLMTAVAALATIGSPAESAAGEAQDSGATPSSAPAPQVPAGFAEPTDEGTATGAADEVLGAAQAETVQFWDGPSFTGSTVVLGAGAYVGANGEFKALPNRSMSSLVVPTGMQAIACDSAAVSDCTYFAPGNYRTVTNFDDRAAVLVVARFTPLLYRPTGTGVELYADPGQSGERSDLGTAEIASGSPWVIRGLTSIRVHLGRLAVLCNQPTPYLQAAERTAGFPLGSCVRYGPGDHRLSGAFNDKAVTVAVAPAQDGPPRRTHLDSKRLNEVTLAGSHNTFEKKGCRPGPTCDPLAESTKFEYLWDALRFVQVIEIDMWSDFTVSHGAGIGSDNNCPKSGRYDYTRNQDIKSCLLSLREWHNAYPDHDFTIVKIEVKDGFSNKAGRRPEDLDLLLDTLTLDGEPAPFPTLMLFTPGRLKDCWIPSCPPQGYGTPEQAAAAGNWPTMGQLRGRFMFVITSGTLNVSAPRQYAQALQDGKASRFFPSVLLESSPAGQDSRAGFFGPLAPWVVVADMQYGRVVGSTSFGGLNGITYSAPTIDPAYVRTLGSKGLLLFTSIGDPLTFIGTGFSSLNGYGSASWGQAVIDDARRTFNVQVINTDREKVALDYNRPLGATAGTG